MKEIKVGQNHKAKVDDEVYEQLSGLGSWYYENGYAVTGRWPTKTWMHHVVLPRPNGNLLEIDHIDRDRLNNQRNNLRYSTHRENILNSKIRTDNKSGHKGVSWSERQQKWIVMIQINKKPKYLGAFLAKEDAIRVRLEAEDIHYQSS